LFDPDRLMEHHLNSILFSVSHWRKINEYDISSKAMHSIIVIKFSIKIQVGMSFLQKFRTDSYGIFSFRFLVSEIGHFWLFHTYGLFGTGVFDPKTGVFGPKTGVLLVMWNSDHSIMTQYRKYGIQKKVF